MLSAMMPGLEFITGSSTSMVMLLAKATLILVVALGITFAMQRSSAGARHLVWLVTLATLLLVPALTAWSPLRLEILPSIATTNLPSTAGEGFSSSPTATEKSGSAPSSNTYIYTTDGGGSSTSNNPLADMSGASTLLLAWAVVMLALGAWLAYGAFVVRRIVRGAHPLDTRDWLTPLWEIADRLELEQPPRLLASADAKMPFACGFFTPTIVLSADCDGWSEDRRRAVLLHELAHVKRRDLVGHTLGRLACAIYWFHPLVWTAAKQLRNESERACDDLALSCGAKASDYAEHLLDIVTSVRHDATPAVALAMARRKDFEGRMLAILDPELRHSTPNRRQSAILVGSLAVIAMVVGAAAPAPRAPAVVLSSAVPVAMGTPDVNQDAEERPAPDPAPSASPAAKLLQDFVEPEKDKHVDEADEEKTAKEKAIERLGEIAPEAKGAAANDDRPVLLANILRTDKDASLRRLAAWGLSQYADTRVAADALAFALRRDSDASVREMAGWALGDGRDNTVAVTALIEALRTDPNERVRSIAAWSLGHIGARDAVAALTAAMSDNNKGVRTRAVWAIGHIGPKEAPPAIFALLRDPSPGVRQLAAWALYQIEDPAAIGPLNAALKAEQDSELKIDYIRALAAVGEKSVDALRGLLESPDPKIKSIAVRALAGGRGAGPWPWPWPEPRPHP